MSILTEITPEDEIENLSQDFYDSDQHNKGDRTEPSEALIESLMKARSLSYYNAREILREEAYGGKPPEGFDSWGMYWKTR